MGTMLTDLATACRKSGLNVVETPGWKTRTRPGGMSGQPRGIVIHYTATPRRYAGDYPTMRVVRDGRPGLGGPLAQLGLGKCGNVYVIAAGRASHAGRTDRAASSNGYAIGIEAEHCGSGPWPPQQFDAYVKLVAALCLHYDIPVSEVRGHKEVAVPYGRKPDPNFDMGNFRVLVAREIDKAKTAKSGDASAVLGAPIGVSVTAPVGYRGTPRLLVEDGIMGNRTFDALMWYVAGDRLTGWTRMNVRAIQNWLGRERTGLLSKEDILAFQAKVSARRDGIWPSRPGQKSNTTLGLQRFLNKRIKEKK